MGAFDKLLEQIDSFIRKFYKNQMLRGVLLFVGIFLASYLIIITLEYFGSFNGTVRAFLFYSFILINLIVFVQYIAIPLAKILSFGKRINRYQASNIIGRFFPDVNDRLLNTLQMNDSVESQTGNIELLRASVRQRANTLSVVPFTKAVDFGENKKYLKYVIPFLIVLLAVGIFVPKMLTESTSRIIQYDKEFLPIAPFNFVLENNNLMVEEGSDVVLKVNLKGEEFPQKLYVKSDMGKFLMQPITKSSASYKLTKVNKSTSFVFSGGGFDSKQYNITVVPKAAIGQFKARIEYPMYLEIPEKVLENPGDIVVPEGAKITWDIITKNTDKVYVRSENKTKEFTQAGIRFEKVFKTNDEVVFGLVNNRLNKVDTLNYNVDVIKDQFPGISVSEMKDSLNDNLRFFSGVASDDYGVRSLKFAYSITKKDGTVKNETVSVSTIGGTKNPFNMSFDFTKIGLELEDKLTYYFIVYDNDGVNGSKSSKSQIFAYKMPSREELDEKRSEEGEKMKDELKEAVKQSQELTKKVEELKRSILDSKTTDWKQMQQLENLKNERESLEKRLENLNKQMTESIQEKNQLTELDERIMEKQELIEQLMEEVMDDELKELLEKLEEMMKQQDQKKMNEMMEDLEMSSEDMDKQLDRTLEALKKMQVNEKIDDLEDALKELAEEQKELKEGVEKGLDKEEAVKKQDDINKEYEKLQEKMEEMLKENEELDRPMDLDELSQEQEEIKESLEDSKESLEKGKEKKAGEQQENSSEKMEEMAAQLDAMQQQSESAQNQEDIETLRSILENLMTLSFDQEFNMDGFRTVSTVDPNYLKLGKDQQRIISDTKPVEDSLMALAGRVPKIASFVDKELGVINRNYRDLVDDIDERRKSDLNIKQQYVMTGMNNLALFLNESLENMQQEQQKKDGKPGSGSCDKPGGMGKGKPKPGGMSPSDMKKMLEEQLKSMEKGMNPGGDKPGDAPGQGKPGQGGMPMPGLGSKQMAQMAAQQSAIRERLEQLKKELNKEGEGKGNGLNPLLKELEEQEKNIVNKVWNREMVKRQKQILTRLLESEKAIEERGFDEKRESKSGKDIDFGNQIQFDEYKQLKEKQIELLRSLDPSFGKYYRDRANEYFNKMN